ncbi:uncharacterized protein LOC100120444 [Nasonia vitripennis]|uniref:CUB domain-containing protein n=1 Tax=Nasonia vitripennis TaxID=7425 RepID=A0A7M7HCK6_NASVI|nr:uncharacterized protein LOC100120444 [Nasonia vitripennis]XP_008216933.1 uncharacterized protein LOC100120444 [Nasonia vitripennis]
MSRLHLALTLGSLVLLAVPSAQWPYPLWSTASQPQKPARNGLTSSSSLLPRVLSFFPEPVAEECLSADKRRRGICMNTYDCRIQRGTFQGPCALGFGVCCVFTASCGGEVQNNLTYVTSPGFPNLIDQAMNCSVLVKKIEQQVSQLRIDFLHFNIGQPNRRTGVCDDDVMLVRSGEKTFQLCGWNSGQHIYVDIGEEPVTINFRLPGNLTSRMWEMRVVQLGFEQRAPAGCLQYLQAANGTLKTLNYLPNGRYLANHDYLICIRQEYGMCSVAYAPCTEDSFRIGGPNARIRNITTVQSPDEVDDGSGSAPESSGLSLTRCKDRVLIPCDFEEFITPGNDGAGICDLEHCGTTFCGSSGGTSTATTTESSEPTTAATAAAAAGSGCRVETSALPFHIRVAFGPGEDTGTSPEDNVGMCLSYEQLPCVP